MVTADAIFHTSTANYDYRVVLMSGEYTFAATCEGSLDTDAPGDGITLLAPLAPTSAKVTVTAEASIEDLDF